MVINQPSLGRAIEDYQRTMLRTSDIHRGSSIITTIEYHADIVFKIKSETCSGLAVSCKVVQLGKADRVVIVIIGA